MGESTEYTIAKNLMMFVGDDQPCNYNGMDDFVSDDPWCEEHCGKCDCIDCWVHAVHARWIQRHYDNMIEFRKDF